MSTTFRLSDLIMASLDKTSKVPRYLLGITFTGSTSEQKILLDVQSNTITSPNNVELIRLKSNNENNSDFVLKTPFIYDRVLISFVKTLNLDQLKCSLTSNKSTASFNVTSHDIKLPLANNYTDMITLQITDEGKEIFKLSFYREPLSIFPTPPPELTSNDTIVDKNTTELNTNSLRKKSSAALEVKNPFPIPMSDGPLFREALNSYEQLAPYILKQLQSTIDNINSLDHSLKGLESSKSQLMDSLRDFRKEYLPTVSKNDVVYSKFEFLQSNSSSNEDLIRSLLKALQHSTSETKIDFSAFRSLQNFNSSKKIFEDESKKYYDWLSKLMSSGKSKDEKLLLKTKTFIVSQMDYFNFLYDTVTPMLLSLVQPTSLITKTYWRNRPLRDQAVQKIKNCSTFEELTGVSQIYSRVSSNKDTLLLLDKNSPYKFGKFDGPLKAGLLFVFGGQGKSGWHKQWIVLCDGKLYEFMDWRRGAELRNTPLDVSLCNIKLLDSQDNNDIGVRKNCFRVINAQGTEHVFQCLTSSDAKEWVKTLCEAGKMIAFNNPKNINTASLPKEKHIALVKQRISRNDENCTPNKSITSEDNIISQKDSPRIRRVSSVSLSLLHVVQHNDASNMFCVDCGTKEQVEWISLNLLNVFCIHCSSAHRALGTTISKVRSLTLDSFVGENRALVYHINNAKVNSVYEAELSPKNKPTSKSGHETRLEFITNKYMKKAYVDSTVKKNASLTLLEGVRDDDISKVLKGIAGGADVNKKVSWTTNGSHSSIDINKSNSDELIGIQITFLEYALLHPSILDGREVFDVAELLALNGCDAGSEIRSGSKVDESGRNWWQERIDRMNGGISPSNDSRSTPIVSNQTRFMKPAKPAAFDSNTRTSISTSRPSLSLSGSYKKPTTPTKSKIKSPKEGFNLFKKKLKNLE
ncbi:hypothetical protein C6P42_005117 [Pichia californica]|nr:hypothetical protein C6P42_005117 [[Candida] californica]